MVAKAPTVVLRFGPYELHSKTQELYKHGSRLKVRPQALRLLALLASKAGEVVTREEIQEQMWSAETFVDFEHSLNTAVKTLRGVLSDSPGAPSYIETLPKIGYRFVALVETASMEKPTLEQPTIETPDRSYAVRAEAEVADAAMGIVPAVAEEAPAAKTTSDFVAPVEEGGPWWLKGVAIAALVLLVLVAAGTYWRWASRGGKPVAVVSGRTVLAVLPFQNLTGGADEEYFSDGLTEEMIAEFGRLDPEHLGVIARTSVMHYKHSDEKLDQIGRELKVQYALEGSVRRDANKVRISAQLIQVADQTRMWSREYDRELSDLLTLQSEIARDIGGEIRVTLSDAKNGARPAAPLSPESVEAHDLYLRALYFWNKRTAEGFQRAVEYFQQAVVKDPNYARAYAGLADSYVLMSGYAGIPSADLAKKARAAAEKAVALDDQLAEAHTARAVVAQDLDWDWKTAEKEYRRAIELNPNYATAHHWYAEYLALMGRFDEAEVQIELARQLDPLSLIIATDHGVIMYYARNYDAALVQLRAVLEMEPAYPRANTIDDIYLEKGMRAEALADVAKKQAIGNETPWDFSQRAYVNGQVGRAVEARQALEVLQELDRKQHVDPIAMATAYLGIKDEKRAVDWLERAYAERSVSLTSLNVDPIYDPLRGDARFKKLLMQMSLGK